MFPVQQDVCSTLLSQEVNLQCNMQYIRFTYAESCAENLVKNLSRINGKYWNMLRTKQASTFDLVNQSANGNKYDLVFKLRLLRKCFISAEP